VKQIRGALDSTTDLLTALLDMSRLEAGGLDPQPRAFALADVLEPLASEFRVLAAERGLAFDALPTCAWVHSDPQLLRRVLQNFLANAVRYTQHGRIVLGVRRAGGALRIEVHDTGPGIEADAQSHIFEEFRRGDDAAGQGLGLGLAIADRIAKLLGAPLTLRSRPGAGTMFAVTLPRVATPRIAVSVAAKGGLGRHARARTRQRSARTQRVAPVARRHGLFGDRRRRRRHRACSADRGDRRSVVVRLSPG
jgi:signal transduction histidine kinase